MTVRKKKPAARRATPATVTKRTDARIDNVLGVLLMLDDDELWEFVRRMLPEATIDDREDVYDVLLYIKLKDEPTVPLEEALAELESDRAAA